MSAHGGEGEAEMVAAARTVPQAVEALSAGRARRTTAGNRMRELLEQERERMLAEGEESERTRTGGMGAHAGEKEGEEGDNVFVEEDNDVDFEDVRGGGNEAEDIIDSDFDLSSDQGEEDEEEGERKLVEEERAAKKASRAKAKALPGHMQQGPTVPPDGAEQRQKRPTKRISFAASRDDQGDRIQRSSKRQSTMEVTQTVQERIRQEEQRRAKQNAVAPPRRKKVRLSQGDHIAEALEMEERNRESLKAFLEREEDRKKRDRKRGKKRMDGPFLRWHSFAVDRSAKRRPIVEAEAEKEHSEVCDSVTTDPVLAAREAAVKAKAQSESDCGAREDGPIRLASISAPEDVTQDGGADGEGNPRRNADLQTHLEALQAPSSGRQEGQDVPLEPHPPASSYGKKEFLAARTSSQDGSPLAVATGQTQRQKSVSIATPERDPLTSPDKSKENDAPDWEARAYVSLHGLPASTAWHTLFAHILGSHVDWSRYVYVPARNRPLRPRQSVCPITGLPAHYRDPRTGIAFANREAYDVLTRAMRGDYRWSGGQGKTQGTGSIASTNPLEMGCYMDRLDEPGACNVLLMAAASMASGGGDGNDGRVAKVSSASRPSLAPGDEKAVMAAAQALPAGSTRSGGRRSQKG